MKKANNYFRIIYGQSVINVKTLLCLHDLHYKRKTNEWLSGEST